MKISYETSISPILTEARLSPSTFNNSSFFLNKEDGYFFFQSDFKEDLNIKAVISNIRETPRTFVVEANTDNIIATNIEVDGVYYFYKLSFIGGDIDLVTLLLNSNISFVEYDGGFYTNEYFSNIEINPGLYIFSEPLFTKKNAKTYFKKNHIEIVFPKKLGALVFKPMFNIVCQPRVVNSTKVFFDSFYIKNRKNIFKCIDGDVLLFDKIEFTKEAGNFLEPKDIVEDSYNNFYNSLYNKIYFDSFYYTNTNRNLLKYKAKTSSHVFDIEDTLYLKIGDKGITIGNENNYSLKITRSFDLSKINLYLSEHLNNYRNTLDSKDYHFSYSPIEDKNRVELRENVVTDLSIHPSSIRYVTSEGIPYFCYNSDKSVQRPFYNLEVDIDLEECISNPVFEGTKESSSGIVFFRDYSLQVDTPILSEWSFLIKTQKDFDILVESYEGSVNSFIDILSEDDINLTTEIDEKLILERRG